MNRKVPSVVTSGCRVRPSGSGGYPVDLLIALNSTQKTWTPLGGAPCPTRSLGGSMWKRRPSLSYSLHCCDVGPFLRGRDGRWGVGGFLVPKLLFQSYCHRERTESSSHTYIGLGYLLITTYIILRFPLGGSNIIRLIKR